MGCPTARLAALVLILGWLTGCATAPPVPAATPRPETEVPPTVTEPPPTITAPPPTPTIPPTATPDPGFREDFSGTLDPGWSWIRENDAKWSLEAETGHLRIVLEGGQFHRNLLLREVKGADFEITTHLLFEPTTNFQIAGLLIYQDDATMIKLGRAFCNIQNACVGNGIYFDSQQNARFAGANFATDTPLKDEAYLRITKRGNSFVGAYSEDGTTWMVIGRHESAMSDPKVGLVAGQSNVVGQVALFDFFTLVELP